MLAMSTTEFPYPNNIYKKPSHRRNDSDELDVFEAAMYFSGTTEVYSCRGGIISLQVPLRNSSLSKSQPQVTEKPVMTKEKTKSNKQPTSPGGKIAHFLISLFNQTSSKEKKKKKPKSTTTQSIMKDHEFDEGGPGGPRKRRSSISHMGSAPIADPKPISNYGFRTPPPYAITPTKGYKDLRSYSDHKPPYLQKVREYPYLDGKLDLPHACPDQKLKSFGTDGIWDRKCQTENKESKKFDEHVEDDGAESDSSSDLFELENHDLGYSSLSGLPVYETTHVDNIKRGAPFSNGTAI